MIYYIKINIFYLIFALQEYNALSEIQFEF